MHRVIIFTKEHDGTHERIRVTDNEDNAFLWYSFAVVVGEDVAWDYIIV